MPQDGGRDGVAVTRGAENAQYSGRTGFLAQPRQPEHIQHFRHGRKDFQRDAQFFAGQVIEMGFQLRDLLIAARALRVGGRSFGGFVFHEPDAQPGVLGGRTVARAQTAYRAFRRVEGIRQHMRQRGAVGRKQLAGCFRGVVAFAQRQAAQEQGGRRRGQGKDSLRTAQHAGLPRQRRGGDPGYGQSLAGQFQPPARRRQRKQHGNALPGGKGQPFRTDAVGLRLSYASGYRAPQAYNEDLHIDVLNRQAAIIHIDPELRPEHSHSISASADLYHNFGRVETNLLVEGFYTHLTDVFALSKVGEDSAGNIIKLRHNASGATVKGITTEFKVGIVGIFELQAGYTFQRSRYDEPERWSDNVEPQRRMFRSPDSYGYLTADVDLTRRLTASVFGNYTGPMLVQHNAGYIAQDTERLTPSFWDMGLRMAYAFRLTDFIGMELSAGVKNLLDSFQNDLDYGPAKDSVYIYGPTQPRTFFVGLKFTL